MNGFNALGMFIGILLMLRIYLVDYGRLNFWKLAHIFSDDFFNLMDEGETWIYSSSKLSKPSDDYIGPFFFQKNGKTHRIFALKDSIEDSQQRFVKKFQPLVPKKPFPVLSLIAMIYPTCSMIFPPNPIPMIVFNPRLAERGFSDPSGFTLLAYGFVNLSYLLIAAGIFVGSFRILGLDYRVQVFAAAIIFLVLGLGIFNI